MCHDECVPAIAEWPPRVNVRCPHRRARVEHRIAIDRCGIIGTGETKIQRAPRLHIISEPLEIKRMA